MNSSVGFVEKIVEILRCLDWNDDAQQSEKVNNRNPARFRAADSAKWRGRDYASVIPTNAGHQDPLSFEHLRVLQFSIKPEQQSD